MIKVSCLSLSLFLICFRSVGQTPHFQIKFSETLAVFQFVDNLSANAPLNPFKKLFNGSEFDTERYKNFIAEYDKINVDYGYEYTTYPYAQKIGGSTESLLKRNLVNSSSVNEFKMMSLGIIPNADLFKLCDILSAFEPVYQKLVYQPCKEKFEQQVNILRNSAGSGKIGGFFATGLKFYNSSWDSNIPFIVALYPLPGTLHFNATAFYNNAVVAVPSGLENYNKLLSVMIHEIYHILYDEESLDLKKSIEQAFLSNPSKNSRYAYLLLNEALATSLGNGYVYGQLNGVEDTASWYRRKYTNQMAKKIYPLVRSYISAGKPINKDFVNSYIKLYDENFSGWLTEKDNIMTDRYVISDNTEDFNAVDARYPYRSMAQYTPEVTGTSIEKMKEVPITKLVIISKNNNNELQLLKQHFNELKNWHPDYTRDFSYSVFLRDKTFLIILNNVKKNTDQQLDDLKIGLKR